jgi:magnesium transporter
MDSETQTAESLENLLRRGPIAVSEAVATTRAEDIAEVLNRLKAPAAAELVSAMPFDFAVKVLEHPEFERRGDLFQHFDPASAARFIEAMPPDQQTDLFRELPERTREDLLGRIDAKTRASVKALLRYAPTTAGGLMTTDYVSVPSTGTAREILDQIRHTGRTARPVYAVYVVHPATDRLVTAVSLRELVGADPTTVVGEIGERRKVVTVTPDTDREEVARLIAKYNLLAIPVVSEGHLLGTITVDDVIDAIVKEQTEDVQKSGGMEALDQPYTQIGFFALIRKRAGWLCALFLSEMLTATAMQHFEKELSRAIVLSLFIPLIMSSGGNSGSQATSLIIRALALGELRVRDWWRTALREAPAGLTLGGILGLIGAIRIALWQAFGFYDYGAHWLLIAATVSLALIGVVAFGSLAGAMLPFILRALRFDPASASAPFVATLVDVTGLSIYFGVAYLVLRGTML